MGKCGCRRCHVASKNKASVIDIVMRNLWFITICNSFIYVNIVKLNYFMSLIGDALVLSFEV